MKSSITRPGLARIVGAALAFALAAGSPAASHPLLTRDHGSNEVPSAEPLHADAPMRVLPALKAELAALLPEIADDATRRSATNAHDAIGGALDRLNSGREGAHRYAEHLEIAAAEFDALAQTREHIFLAMLAQEGGPAVARVAQRNAARMLDLAERAGVDRTEYNRHRATFDEGLVRAQRGDHAAAVSKYNDALQIATNLKFDVERFEGGIRARVGTQSTGSVYAITEKGQLGPNDGIGSARLPSDGAFVAQSPTKEMTVASVSKTITGIAVMRALQETGVSVDSSVAPYFPSNWFIHPSIQSLTFRDLMTHSSGFGGQNNQAPNFIAQDINRIRGLIATGVVASQKSYLYQNVNFGIFRIIIPYLMDNALCFGCLDAAEQSNTIDLTTQTMFQTFLQTRIFDVAGIQASCRTIDPLPTRYFVFGSILPGADGADYSAVCGGRGMYFSAVDLAAVLVRLTKTEQILSTESLETMRTGFLGWMNPDPSFGNWSWGDGLWGSYFNHGGDWGFNNPQGGIDTCVMTFPNDVTATLLINSAGGDYVPGAGNYQCQALADAFDDAWTG